MVTALGGSIGAALRRDLRSRGRAACQHHDDQSMWAFTPAICADNRPASTTPVPMVHFVSLLITVDASSAPESVRDLRVRVRARVPRGRDGRRSLGVGEREAGSRNSTGRRCLPCQSSSRPSSRTRATRQVVLFGSGARGKLRDESDVDLLVVTNDNNENNIDTTSAIYTALPSRRLPTDILVVTPQQIKFNWNNPGCAIRLAAEEGRVLYDKDTCRPPAGLSVP